MWQGVTTQISKLNTLTCQAWQQLAIECSKKPVKVKTTQNAQQKVKIKKWEDLASDSSKISLANAEDAVELMVFMV